MVALSQLFLEVQFRIKLLLGQSAMVAALVLYRDSCKPVSWLSLNTMRSSLLLLPERSIPLSAAFVISKP